MYAKCGALIKAKDVFEGLPSRNVVSWNALITGYVQAGCAKEALKFYEWMQCEGVSPNAVTFISILKACGSMGAFDKGEIAHSEIDKQQLLVQSVALGNTLVDMYVKCGALAKAEDVLEGLPRRDVVSWSVLISGYAQAKCGNEALDCFERMQLEGLFPDVVTFTCILKSCGSLGALQKGERVHFEVVKQGVLDGNVVLGSCLVDMYAKCGAFVNANRVLEGLDFRDAFSWSALITGYAVEGHAKEALLCFEQMQWEGVSPDSVTFICILNVCGNIGALDKGENIHLELDRQGLLGNVTLGNALIEMYVRCDALCKAKAVLDGLVVRDVLSWNVLVAGYVQGEQINDALSSFEQMHCEGLYPNAITLACILKACGIIGAVDEGTKIHSEIVEQNLLDGNVALGNALVDMYAKCGALAKAKEVFEGLPVRDVLSWSALVAGYTQAEHGKEALECYEQMKDEGFFPDDVLFVSILNACAGIGALDKGENIHYEVIRQGLLDRNVVLGNTLVDMYAKCSALGKAKEVLEELPVRDVVSWSTLITGYVEQEHNDEALMCFDQMQHEGLFLDEVTFGCILRAYGSIGEIDRGECVHYEISRQGYLTENSILAAALVDMYAKCGALMKAREVLEGLPFRDVVAWSALIAGYSQGEYGKEALNCFEWMQFEGLSPDAITFSCILKACGNMGTLDKGEDVHLEVVKQELVSGNVVLVGALVDMYAKCGALTKAKVVLEEFPMRNVILWNTLISGYAHGEHGEEVLRLFEKMQDEGHFPDAVTFACLLKACGSLGALEKGEIIHSGIVGQGMLEKHTLLGNVLVDMYAKCGALVKAVEVFEELPLWDVGSWNALIGAYVQEDYNKEALICFEWMQHEAFYPNAVTYTCILNACGNIGALDSGKSIHSELVRQGLIGRNVVLGGALVDMYAKCCALAKAREVLEGLALRDVVSWNALIAGYAQGEYSKEILGCLDELQREGLSPDQTTFLCVLSGCGHSCLQHQGQNLYFKMKTDYDVFPDLEHHTCMVILFGRLGLFDNAVAIIEKMRSSNDLTMWLAILNVCKDWGNVKVGKWAFEHAIQVNVKAAAAYVCMSSIYAAGGMKREASKVEASRVINMG